jgi:hypothetical protein
VPADADLLAQPVHPVLQGARQGAVVEDHLLEARAMIAQGPRDRIALARDARRQVGRRLDVERQAPDLLPPFEHARGVGLQDVGGGAGGGGAQHDPAVQQTLDMAAQAVALQLSLDAAGEGHAGTVGMVDEIAAADGDVHRQARTLVALAVVTHLHEDRRAGRRPAVAAREVLGPQEARALDADVDEGRIEIGHHALQAAEEYALDPGRTVAANDLKLHQPAFGDQRHQERRGQHMADEAIGAAHGAEASRSATVSNSGNPTTLL